MAAKVALLRHVGRASSETGWGVGPQRGQELSVQVVVDAGTEL